MPRPGSPGQRVKNRGSRTESLGQTVKARESRPRNQGQKVKTREPVKRAGLTFREPESEPPEPGIESEMGPITESEPPEPEIESELGPIAESGPPEPEIQAQGVKVQLKTKSEPGPNRAGTTGTRDGART